jgi:hypothetical protein
MPAKTETKTKTPNPDLPKTQKRSLLLLFFNLFIKNNKPISKWP